MLTVPSKTKMICLIKPQFELSKKSLNKNGVVKKDEYIEEVINKIKDFMKAIKLWWENTKEKKDSILDSIPFTYPSMLEAYKIQKKI